MEDTNITPTSEVAETQVESQNIEGASETIVTEVEEKEVDAELDNELEQELEALKTTVKPKRTEEEKAKFTVEKIYEKFPHLRDGVATVIEHNDTVDDDDRPLTRAEFKKWQEQVVEKQAEKSALELAEAIPNRVEREMVKFHIENTIRPSGNAQQDLAVAKSLVSAKRNEIALKEQARKGVVKTTPSSTSAPAKQEDNTQLTAEEQKFVSAGLLTKEDIIKARGKDISKQNFI
jgi:hypothetical protein